MQHPDRPTVMIAREAIAPLQQSVLAWMDADRVLPADGSSLLALLERALTGLASEDGAAARAGVAAFIGRVEALVEAGAIEIEDGQPPLGTAHAVLDVLRGHRY